MTCLQRISGIPYAPCDNGSCIYPAWTALIGIYDDIPSLVNALALTCVFDGSLDADYQLNGLLFDRLLSRTLPRDALSPGKRKLHVVGLRDSGARGSINVCDIITLDNSLPNKSHEFYIVHIVILLVTRILLVRKSAIV